MCVYRTEDGVCEKHSTEEFISYCVDGPCPDDVWSNAERIRAMSDKELAEWICSLMSEDSCEQRCPGRDMCHAGILGLLRWMYQPVSEGRNEHKK